MSDEITSLTERGQVSVPARFRRAAKLKPGQGLRWEMISDHEFRVYVTSRGEPEGIFAALGFAKRWNPANRTTDEMMRELREGEGG